VVLRVLKYVFVDIIYRVKEKCMARIQKVNLQHVKTNTCYMHVGLMKDGCRITASWRLQKKTLKVYAVRLNSDWLTSWKIPGARSISHPFCICCCKCWMPHTSVAQTVDCRCGPRVEVLRSLSQGSEEALLLALLVLSTVPKICSRTTERQEGSVVDHRRGDPYVLIPVCW